MNNSMRCVPSISELPICQFIKPFPGIQGFTKHQDKRLAFTLYTATFRHMSSVVLEQCSELHFIFSIKITTFKLVVVLNTKFQKGY